MTTLIGKTAAELKVEVSKMLEPGEDDTFIFPEDFQSLVAKDFLCKVRIAKDYNLANGYKDFGIDTMTDDSNIIQQYCELAYGVSKTNFCFEF